MFTKYRIEFFIFVALGNLLTLFGYSSIKTTSRILAFLFLNVFQVRRKIVINNLKLAFPNLSEAEIKSLAYKNYKSIAIAFLEIYSLKKLSKDVIVNSFSDEGFDVIRKKYQEQKGLILLTAHFGNWEMGAIASGLHLDKSITVLVKKQKNPFVANWLDSFRERFGNKQIYLGVSIRELYKSIINNNIIGIVGDQRGKRDGIKVKFFGRETLTFPGTAAIALKTKCPVMVLLCARTENGDYKAIIEPLEYLDIPGDKEEKIRGFNQKYMSILESAIKKHPEQWFWMHNIWKY